MSSEPVRYQLTTIKDIFDQIPADRIEACLSELAVAMRQAKEIAALIGATAADLAEQEIDCQVVWPDSCTWADDGAGTIELKFQTPAGDNLLNCVVTLPDD